jgi:hypothetical protein
MLTSARIARSVSRSPNQLVNGQWRSDFKEALIVVLLWLAVCVLAGLWASPDQAQPLKASPRPGPAIQGRS